MKLFKKRGKWWVDFTAGGKRHRQTTGTANRKLAEAWMANIDVARKMPTFESAVEVLRMLFNKPAKGMIPIEAAWETYAQIARATGRDAVAKSTIERRRTTVDRFVAWAKEKRATIKTIEGVDGPCAAGYAEFLAASGLKTKTRANIIGELSATWRLLEKASDGVKNPWTALTPRVTDSRRGHAFSPEQEERVLEAAKKVGKDWWPVCKIMRMTGLRYGDVATLRWDAIETAGGTAAFLPPREGGEEAPREGGEASEFVGGVIRVDPRKTSRHGIEVVIPIIAPIGDVLAQIAMRGDYLFPLHAELYGNRGRASREALNFREVLQAAGIEGDGYTIHSWRHTAATRLAEAGADIETRKRVLGHTVDETARRYDHDAHIKDTAAALEAAAGVTAAKMPPREDGDGSRD